MLGLYAVNTIKVPSRRLRPTQKKEMNTEFQSANFSVRM